MPGDLVAVGDVVMVRAMTNDDDGSFKRWSLRQVPEVQGGFMAMDVNTGRVIAMQGGFSYQASVFNRATQAHCASRAPASSPSSMRRRWIPALPPRPSSSTRRSRLTRRRGLWTPKNASNKFYGPTPLRTGIEQSRNLMTIRIGRKIGMDVVAEYAETFRRL